MSFDASKYKIQLIVCLSCLTSYLTFINIFPTALLVANLSKA
jgi:hypothetical protein